MLTGSSINVVFPACQKWQRSIYFRSKKVSTQTNRANSQIRAKEVRVIDQAGEQLGIITLEDAIERAQSVGLDLVEVAATATPPVCRIMDFGSFKFQKKKKEKDAKKKQHVIHVKEIRLSPKIEQHDFDVKLNRARKFLEKHDRVLLNLRFRGREIMYADLAEEVIVRFVEACADVAKADGAPRRSGRRIEVTLIPDSKAKGKGESKDAKAEDA